MERGYRGDFSTFSGKLYKISIDFSLVTICLTDVHAIKGEGENVRVRFEIIMNYQSPDFALKFLGEIHHQAVSIL